MNKKKLRNVTILVTTAIMISQYPVAVANAAPPEDGNWTLLPASSDEFDGACLDESKWTNGTVVITNSENPTYCVDLKGDVGATKNGTAVLQYPYHGAVNQKWYLVPTKDGAAVQIMSALSGKALCVKDASTEEHASIIQWTYESNTDANDEWTFVPVVQ